jgi:hypothetical protein
MFQPKSFRSKFLLRNTKSYYFSTKTEKLHSRWPYASHDADFFAQLAGAIAPTSTACIVQLPVIGSEKQAMRALRRCTILPDLTLYRVITNDVSHTIVIKQ